MAVPVDNDGLTPVTFLTVGTRDLAAQGWNVFFDNPPRRPHQTFPAALDVKSAVVRSHGANTTVVLDGLTAGPFRGRLQFTVYPGCRLVHAEAVVRTDVDGDRSLSEAIYRAVDHADLIIAIGHDTVEKPPFIMGPDGPKVIHVGFTAANVEQVYFPHAEIVGDVRRIRIAADDDPAFGELGRALEQPAMAKEDVARIRLAARRTTQK